MSAKIKASSDGLKVTIGNAAEDALEINQTAKTIKGINGYVIVPAAQTWQDVTTSRVLGTVYTNNTGQPIDVFVALSSSLSAAAAAVVNGTTIGYGTGAVAGTILSVGFKVPAGATYTSGASAGVPTLSSWFELRN